MGKSVLMPLVAAAAGLTFVVAFADKAHVVTGTIVSVDAAAQTLTLRRTDGQTSTAQAEGEALKALGALQAGEPVAATWLDDDVATGWPL